MIEKFIFGYNFFKIRYKFLTFLLNIHLFNFKWGTVRLRTNLDRTKLENRWK
jgi:hypothetical protein